MKFDIGGYVQPRRASLAETKRFQEAFLTLLAERPGEPPGPAGIARLMGLGNKRNLNGRLSHLRIRMLEDHGFYKDDRDGRWYHGGRP